MNRQMTAMQGTTKNSCSIPGLSCSKPAVPMLRMQMQAVYPRTHITHSLHCAVASSPSCTIVCALAFTQCKHLMSTHRPPPTHTHLCLQGSPSQMGSTRPHPQHPPGWWCQAGTGCSAQCRCWLRRCLAGTQYRAPPALHHLCMCGACACASAWGRHEHIGICYLLGREHSAAHACSCVCERALTDIQLWRLQRCIVHM
jgi:hypothetical protein